MRHELKCWPVPFESVLSGTKTHEVRKADRPYGVGDILRLREWTPESKFCTGREVLVVVTDMTLPGSFGLPDGLCVMSVRRTKL